MFTAFVTGLASTLIYDFNKNLVKSISKKEYVQLVLKNLGLNNSISDFSERYMETLVELRFTNKTKEILEFFRDETIMSALHDYYYAREDSGLLFNEVEYRGRLKHFMESLMVGDDIKKENINIEAEIQFFCKTFKQKIHESRNVSDVELYKNISDIKKDTSSLVKDSKSGNIAKATLPKRLTLEIPTISPDAIVGRTKDLDDLRKLLLNKREALLINGFGGIGKTTIAQVYTHKYWEEYHHIAWITQKPESSFLNDFISSEGLRENLCPKDQLNEPIVIFNNLVRKLNTIQDSPNLLIIDNANESVEEFKDKLPNSPSWHILLTSREELNGFTTILLDFLNEDDAFKLFKLHYKIAELNDDQIKELIYAVDYHTLTIEILAKTAMHQRYSFQKLKDALTLDISVDVKINRPGSHEKIEKITSFLCSIFSLSHLNKDEIWLMQQMVCLPSEYHSYSRLLKLINPAASQRVDVFSKIINDLSQKGWLLRNVETDKYKMHLVLAQVVKKQHPPSIADISFLFKYVTELLRSDQIKDNPIDKFQWISYGNLLLDMLENQVSTSIEEKNMIANLQNNLAMLFQIQGNFQEAISLLEKSMKSDIQNFGHEHPSTAGRYTNLAIVLNNNGEINRAKPFFEKALESDKLHFEPFHQRIAIGYSNLGLVLQKLKKYDSAKTHLEKALELDIFNFGEFHLNTARSYSNLGLLIYELGYLKDAKSLLEKTLNIVERELGSQHPTTNMHYTFLAQVLHSIGDLERAVFFQEKALKFAENKYGQENHITAQRCTNLAMVFQDQGDLEKALKLSGKALEIFKKLLRPGHPNIKIAEGNYRSIINQRNQKK